MLPRRGAAQAREVPGEYSRTIGRAQGNWGPVAGERYVWTNPDGAKVYVIVSQVRTRQGYAVLRCHHGARIWNRRQPLPLYPSMRLQQWTTTDLQETLQ